MKRLVFYHSFWSIKYRKWTDWYECKQIEYYIGYKTSRKFGSLSDVRVKVEEQEVLP